MPEVAEVAEVAEVVTLVCNKLRFSPGNKLEFGDVDQLVSYKSKLLLLLMTHYGPVWRRRQ